MATFVTHGLLGAASLAGPVRLLNGPRWLRWILGVMGFVLGSAPDTFDWLAAVFFGAPRWALYVEMHHGIYSGICAAVLPCGLHLLVDAPFHPYAGYNWWPDLWWLESLLFIGSAALLVWIFRKRHA